MNLNNIKKVIDLDLVIRVAKLFLKSCRPEVLARWMTVALTIFASHSAAGLTLHAWDFISPSGGGDFGVAEVAADEPRRQNMQPPPLQTGKNIASLHLFGHPGRVVVAPVTNSRDLPESTLQLSLRGVVHSSSAKKSIAIMTGKEADEDDKLYLVGDSLPGNAVLTEIHADRVVIRRAGRDETIIVEELASPPSSGMDERFLRPPTQRRPRRMLRPTRFRPKARTSKKIK
ncbi:MAG: hypothetical protein OEL66_03125 [Desulfobulbaceae bacterium]|nr:hypothetical protein [Desulfobulbaceae bacterium]